MSRTAWLIAALVALLGIVGCGSPSPSAPADGGQCHDLFSSGPDGAPAVACCPDPAPDCSKQADGYPGYLCVDRTNQFCSCSCQAHAWTCGC